MMKSLKNALSRFKRDEKGASIVEAVFALPVLTTLMVSGVEATRFIIANQKVERTSATVGDLVSRLQEVTEGDLADLFAAGDQVMTPFNVSQDGRLIVSSVIDNGNGDVIVWQRQFGGGGANSKVGVQGGTPSLPEGLVVRPGENVIVAEVIYDYTPDLFSEFFQPAELYSPTYFRPRFSNLAAVLP